MEEEKKITIDDLAAMVQNGFNEVVTRLDRIENIILKQHAEQIESLERRIRRLEDALAIK